MQNAIERQIKFLCDRAIERGRARQDKSAEYSKKFTRRTGKSALTKNVSITYVHKHFDPKYCKRNANFLAKTLWHKIVTGQYKPMPALKFEIPKQGGGKRQIMQFAFPDAAVARVLNERLTARNLKKQSGNSFAYRPDRNVFDALLKIKSAIRNRRNFIMQLDFENYFDSIPHAYLKKLINCPDYMTTSDAERRAIERFLDHEYATRIEYSVQNFTKRSAGTPQGSSISLSLSNLANHQLDCELEAINGQFSRYADDTVVICYSYEDALKALHIFLEHCKEGGLRINKKKSPGIWILSDVQEEFRSIKDFRFLGYGISLNGLFMHGSVEKKIRMNFCRLINLYLVHYIESHKPNVKRVGLGFDWDLIGLITELRNIMYGGLSEEHLNDFIKKGKKLPQMRGLMAFYALLDDKAALVRLDGWLVSTIKQALNKRYRIFAKHGNKVMKSITERKLIRGDWYDAATYSHGGFNPDASLPSFVRAWASARKYYFSFGLEGVDPPRYFSYY